MNQNTKDDGLPELRAASKLVTRKELRLMAIWLIGGTALMYYISPFLLKRRFAAFNTAYINAPIESINIADHGFAIQLRVKGASYTFYPITNTDQPAVRDFTAKAQIGDSIKKESESDTLYIMRRNVSHKVLFKHY